MTQPETDKKETILLTIAIDLETLQPVSRVCRFPDMPAKPFEGSIRLPKTSLRKLKEDFEAELVKRKALAREIEERKVVEARRKTSSKKQTKNIPGQQALFEEESCT